MSEQATALRTSFAKVTRPQYADILPRKRLFRLLEGARYPLVWVSAPPGAGKTALASSYLQIRRVPHLWYQLDQGDGDLPTFFHYLGLAAAGLGAYDRTTLPHLTAEYRAGVPTFARRYFETLGRRLEPPFIVVFDNYHEIAPGADLHAVLRDGISALPQGFVTIVLSRCDPPPEFARMRVNGQLLHIEWDELRFTLDEVRSIERLTCRRTHAVSPEYLYEKTQGWAGGLVLLLAQRKSDDSPRPAQGASHRVLFEYFAGEVFAKLDAQIRRVLAASALLGRMTERAVVELTGFAAAGELLEGLNRKNYFTLKQNHAEPVYEYHPLFREFLLTRAEQIFGRTECGQLRARAAALLEAEGQIEDAAALFLAAELISEFVRVVCANAPMFIAHGRSNVVEGWLAGMQDATLTSNPWLLYWQGVCRLPFNASQARACFERAHERFKALGDLPGRCRAWCGIVDSLVFEWDTFRPLDGWIDDMDELLRAQGPLRDAVLEPHVACGMFMALMYCRPWHNDLRAWESRVRQIILHHDDQQLRMKVGNHLLLYYTWWIGDLVKAELLVNTLRSQLQHSDASPLMQTTWYAMAAAYYWRAGANDDCMACARRGLEIGEETGVHTWDRLLCSQAVYASLSANDTELAGAYLKRIEERLNTAGLAERARYYHLCAWLQQAQGNLAVACQTLRESMAMAEDSLSPYAAAVMRTHLGAILCGLGQGAAGIAHIQQARAEGAAMKSQSINYLSCMAEAEHAMTTGDENRCIEVLRCGLNIGAQQRFHNHFWWPSPTMARLYAKALAHGIEVDYVASAIRKRKLAPPEGADSLPSWPRRFSIRTLGMFQVLKDREPLRLSGKAPRKPLELLKALIAFGAVEVNQSSLVDALWPELEGDNAQRALQTALYRLRKLLDDDAMVVLKGGKLSLDAGCWVDSFGLERQCQDVEAALADPGTDTHRLNELATQLLAVYAGHFLPEESGAWALTRRERLRNRFFNTVQQLARHLEGRRSWEAAARCYRRALEIDPLLENFWYRLMLCHERLSQPQDALAVYRRCRHALATGLRTQPSAQVEALRRTLAAGTTYEEDRSLATFRPLRSLNR